MKNVVGTFEAKTKFTELIKRVDDGEEFLVTKRGQPVAKIIPLKGIIDNSIVNAAIDRIRILSNDIELKKFDWLEWKAYRDIGRK